NGKSEVDSIDEKIKPEDAKVYGGYLYVPIRFQGKSAYLFVGLKKVEHELEDYIKILTKHLA
ncbi:MAG: hypothetical protein PQJ46_13310, partial [Spirochaetales bacterium]|nr:hypothetical protein [Spirochaetales bacterium]